MSKAALHYVKKGLLSQSDFEFLKELDPSRTQKYLPFIIKSYLADAALDLLRNRIEEYDTLLERNQIEKKDINEFKSFQQLDEYVQQYNNIKSTREVKRGMKKQADIIVDNDDLFVVCVHSHAASCLYGAGTKWCTTAENSVHFERYFYGRLVTFYYVQVRSDKIRQSMKQNTWRILPLRLGMAVEDLWKIAVVVFPDGKLYLYDAADKLIGSDKARAYEADKLNNLFVLLGVSRALFLPGDMDGRMADYLLYRKRDTELNLSGLGLKRIPDSIGDMVQLKSLILSENRLQAVPESIGRLHNLRTLYLFHNELSSLPESIGSMTDLQWLGLRGNRISNKVIRELKRKLPHTRIYMEGKKELLISNVA